jgi:threonylcarbamoyladenosine tRNA methylthiotransferase MtaB
MAKIHFQTFGCRLNQAESERMARTFRLAGHELVQTPEQADIRVVNTCTVTGEAAKKSRKAARSLGLEQRVVVTGCHSEVAPDEFQDADLLVPSAEKEELATLALERFGMDGLALGMDYRKADPVQVYPLALEQTRAFVKIQDGCDLRCTFCLTTVARGASRCRSVDEILNEVRSLSEQGCREAVLTGVHAGSYQHDGKDLADLMEVLLRETEIPRLRLSSLEPWNFKFSWLRVWKEFPGRMCRHLHMSLQSGSESVLQRMRRHYSPAAYREKIDAIRRAVPEMAVTTDMIVGFPGETDDEHQASVGFVKEVSFADAHVFSFSPRPGTEASRMDPLVDPKVKAARYREMCAVTRASREQYLDEFLGRPVDVLWEKEQANGRRLGLSDHYLKIECEASASSFNEIQRVTPTFRRGEVLVLADAGRDRDLSSSPLR